MIPVLVADAKMPDPDDLPTDVRPLTRRNALELSDGRWRFDIDRLMSRLAELLADTTTINETMTLRAEQPAAPRRSRTRWSSMRRLVRPPSPARVIIEGILVAAVIGVIAGGIANALPSNLSDFDQVLKRVGIWTPVAIGIAIWLIIRFGHREIVRDLLLATLVGAAAAALSGVISFYPADQKPSDIAVTVPSYAVIGFAFGGLMGALWVPRRVGVGMATGIVAGLIVGLGRPHRTGSARALGHRAGDRDRRRNAHRAARRRPAADDDPRRPRLKRSAGSRAPPGAQDPERVLRADQFGIVGAVALAQRRLQSRHVGHRLEPAQGRLDEPVEIRADRGVTV